MAWTGLTRISIMRSAWAGAGWKPGSGRHDGGGGSGGEPEAKEDNLRDLPRGHVTVTPGLADQPPESP